MSTRTASNRSNISRYVGAVGERAPGESFSRR